MTSKQQAAIKSSIVDTNSHLNEIFLSFDSLNKEFHPGNRLVDSFSNHFSFHKANHSSEERKFHHCSCLNNIMLNTLSNPSTVIVVSDTGIKNNVTMSIAHVYSFNNPLKKTLHHAINITSTEAELFAIRCRINQATQISDTSHIIIITDILYVVQRIFDSTIHPYQTQVIAISKDLQRFFKEHLNNSVEFWDCPSNKDWHLHAQVDKETNKFDLIPLYPSKMSWDFSKKKKCDNIIKEWHNEFKTLSLKGNFFLNLLNK